MKKAIEKLTEENPRENTENICNSWPNIYVVDTLFLLPSEEKFKWAKDINGHFKEGEIWMTNFFLKEMFSLFSVQRHYS